MALARTITATPAETALADRLAAHGGAAPGALPHRRIESYHYTDLRTRLTVVPDWATLSERIAGAQALKPLVPGSARLAPSEFGWVLSHVVNGVFVGPVPEGALLPGGLAGEADDPLIVLGRALSTDGADIAVAPGMTPGSVLEIAHAVSADGARLAAQRHRVTVGRGASVVFVEHHGGAGSHLTSTVIELDLEEGATVTWVKLQDAAAGATHFGSLVTRLAANARLDHLTVTTGAKLARSQAFVRFDGAGARAEFDTATLARDGAHIDTTLVVDHAVPDATSAERFRSVVGENAAAVVQGRILVRPDAQKTDARMMTRALLVADTAESFAKPELEIFADDVQCAHGAASGKLDQEAVFYLRSRGVPRKVAEAMMVEAFLVEPIEGGDVDGQDPVRQALVAHLRTALHGGETE